MCRTRPEISEEPVFSITLGFQKLHVVTSPELCQATLNHRNLSFDPWIRNFCKAVLHTSPQVDELLTPRHRDHAGNYNERLYNVMHRGLAGSSAVSDMTIKALESVSINLEAIAGDGDLRNLNFWVRDIITEAVSVALYGHNNPLANDSKMREQFW